MLTRLFPRRLRAGITKLTGHLATALAVALALAGVALADGLLSPDADSVSGIQGSKTFSNVAPGAVLTPAGTVVDPRVVVGIDCNGSSHLARGSSVLFSYSAADSAAPTGGAVSADDATVTIPNTWPVSGSCGTVAPTTATSNVSLTVPKPAAAGASLSYTVGYRTPSDATLPSNIRSKTQAVTYTVSVKDVAPVISNFSGDSSAVEGDTKSYSFDAVDDNGDTPAKSLEVKKVDGGDEVDPGSDVSVSGLDVTFNVPGTYKVRGVASDNVNTTKSDPTTVTVIASNSAPHDVGTPALDGTSSTPNQGAFGLEWTAATDDDGDTLTYELEHKDANSSYSAITGAGSLNSAAFAFTSAAKEDEGTWTYRVRGSDGSLTSDWSADSDPVVVDRTAPTAPIASPDRTPEDSSGGWFKDTVTVSYAGSTDAKLPDDSLGSGVASYTSPQTFNTTGSHNYSGTATDAAGNESTATAGSVEVDATAPTVQITGCPTGNVTIGSTQSVDVTAGDLQSGLATDPSATGVSLNTATIGPKSVSFTATDNVGHQTVEVCAYTVVYPWTGFFQPIDNGSTLNKAKAGSTIPVKFSLSGDRGLSIFWVPNTSDGNTYPSSKGIDCPLSPAVSTVDEVTQSTSGLKYDPIADQYIYNWKTANSFAGGCRELTVKLADGTAHTAKFQFTK